MSNRILQYIGDAINTLNPGVFNTYAVDGIRLKDGTVIKISDSHEKQYIGISDNVGTSFYIRSEPSIQYSQNSGRRISSIKPVSNTTKTCRLVAFTFDDSIESEKLMNKLTTDLKNLRFSTLTGGSKPLITVRRSNSNYADNYLEECRKEFNSGQEFICVSIDFDLRYFTEDCDICEGDDPDSLYVLIVDADDNTVIIARKSMGETYPVLRFSGIDGGRPGTVYTNSIIGGTP